MFGAPSLNEKPALWFRPLLCATSSFCSLGFQESHQGSPAILGLWTCPEPCYQCVCISSPGSGFRLAQVLPLLMGSVQK